MASFDGTANTFGERGGGGGRDFPAHGARAELDVRITPGGAVSIYVVSSQAPEQLTIPAQSTRVELETLIAKVGDEGSLIYVGGTIDALLVEVASSQQVLDGVDLWQYDLQFLVDP